MPRGLKTFASLTAIAALAGCQPSDGNGAVDAADAVVSMEMMAPAAPPPAMAVATDAAGKTASGPPAEVAVRAAQIAYAYRYGLEVPADRGPALMQRHEQACVSAGAAVCQVIGSESTRYGRDSLSARLEIRAVPAFLTPFRARLEGDATAAGGRIALAATDSEDLSRNLSDTEARMRALSTLRDRLQQLLATRNAPLEQLLQTERELARVQGELDATRSALELMRTRVATSTLTITYEATGQLAPDSAFRPVSAALDNALTVFMQALGGLILVFAAILPVALIAVPIIWIVLRRRKAAKVLKAEEPVPPATNGQP